MRDAITGFPTHTFLRIFRLMTQSILFVCLGNICRSPLIAAIARKRLADAGLSMRVDSCGTGGWHVGQGTDRRSIEVAEEGGYSLQDHRVRQLVTKDFTHFDAILAMDDDNLAVLRERCPPGLENRLNLFLEAAAIDDAGGDDEGKRQSAVVSDPYHENLDAFRSVRRLAERGVDGLIIRLRRGEALGSGHPAAATRARTR
jgi:protein-tyrosine phosphatase